MGHKLLRISGDLLIDLFKAGPPRIYDVVEHGLPEDARFVHCHQVNWSDGRPIVLVEIESAEYPEAPYPVGAYPEAEPVVCSLITVEG
jgi:hypothetical protein